MTFSGFPSRPQSTPIPNVFFSDLLPQLTDAIELGVVLYAFSVLSRTKGFPRHVTAAGLAAEPAVAEFLANAGAPGGGIERALARAVGLGILLPLTLERDGERQTLFFLNAPADRRALEAVRTGTVDLGRVVDQPPAMQPRATIFALYESLVGTLSPLVVDELVDAARLYPHAWLEAAFREAAAQNARSWKYVSKILERWAIEGPDHATTERDPAAGRYFEGKYGRILKQRLER